VNIIHTKTVAFLHVNVHVDKSVVGNLVSFKMMFIFTGSSWPKAEAWGTF